MASTLNSDTEVILYRTRATKRTGEFSRLTLENSSRTLDRPEQNASAFRLSVAWAAEEAFTIPNLPIAGEVEALFEQASTFLSD